MLAQNFKTMADLGLRHAEFTALTRVLGMLERKEIKPELFDMSTIGAPECGTAGCLLGWAFAMSEEPIFTDWPASVKPLFIRSAECRRRAATTEEAAFALRSFLTHGDPNWAEAMGLGA